MNDSGWIKIHRNMLDWEWYLDSNIVRLFIHLLLKANWEDKKWSGILIKRGSFVTSYESLSKETKLSIRQVRTCLSKLKLTDEIMIKSTNKYTFITVCKYDSYQSLDGVNDKQATNKRQTNDKQTTTTKEYKNIRTKEDIDIRDNKFKNEIFKQTNFSNTLLNNFYNYWSEKSTSGEKMKFEMQKTFEISKRLATWKNNESKFKEKETSTFAQRILNN